MTAWYLAAAAGAVVLFAAVTLTRQQKWRDSMSLSILGWLFLAAVVLAVTGGILLWLLGWPSLPRAAAFTTTETLDLLKIALAVVAGFGGVVILSVNHRKQRFTEKDHDLAKKQDGREQTKLFNERFAAAAEHLAHDRAQVRLAGVYALAELADDWEAGRQKCVDVLIAYLRLAQSEDRSPGVGEEEVVKTIFRIIRGQSWSEVDFDFTGMTLENFDLSEARFEGKVVFDDVKFTGDRTTFKGTWFVGEFRCHGARFEAKTTTFHRVWFDDKTEFRGCQFTGITNLRSLLIDEGIVLVDQCDFTGPVSFDDLVANPGSLTFDRCDFSGPIASFDRLQIGPMFEPSWMSGLFGRSPVNTKIPGLSFRRCIVRDCELSVDNGYVVRGRLKLTDLQLRNGKLRIRSTETSHPSLWVRGIDAVDSTVDIPVAHELWRASRPAEDGSPTT